MLTRWLPRRLTTQVILTAVMALLISQSLVIPIFIKARVESVAEAVQDSTVTRTANLAKLLIATPPELSEAVLSSVRSRATRVQLVSSQALPASAAHMEPSPRLAANLREAAGGAIESARVFVDPSPSPSQPLVVIQADLQNGQRLETRFQLPSSPASWTTSTLLVGIGLSAMLALVMAWLLRRMTRPLSRLSRAAEALGRGKAAEPLPETGPEDLVETVRAFNQMQVRLREQNEERNRALASVSHDLKTPITALRLQLEFVEDAAHREQMLATLGEMESVTQDALQFFKSTREVEAARKVDIAALLDSVCDELRQIGFEVVYEYESRQVADCRPGQLKRAFNNLIRNACQYGERARIRVYPEGGLILTDIADDGPGIPEDQHGEVRKPFVRLEGSRNRNTGGSGLGLAIANDIIIAHGGRLELRNQSQGGLLQSVRLPA